MDYESLTTPPACVADFCLIPIGTSSASVSNEVAAVQRLMKASGLNYSMHSAGTTVEGPWDAVMRLIGQAHTLIHQNGVVRIQSDIRIGTRTDKSQTFAQKVSKVESILAASSSTSTSSSASTSATPTQAAPTATVDAEGSSGKGDTTGTLLTKGEEKSGEAVGGGGGGGAGGGDPRKGGWSGLFKK